MSSQQPPLVPFGQAMATLQDMFGSSPAWTSDRLEFVLRHEQGSMDNACDRILNHGNQDPQILIDRLAMGGSSSGEAAVGPNNSINARSAGTTAVSPPSAVGAASPQQRRESQGVTWCWKESANQMHKYQQHQIVGNPNEGSSCWIRYDEYQAQELESAYMLEERKCLLQGKYEIDFKKMQQRNVQTGYKRKVQRLEEFYDGHGDTKTPAVYDINGTRIIQTNGEPIVPQATAIVDDIPPPVQAQAMPPAAAESSLSQGHHQLVATSIPASNYAINPSNHSGQYNPQHLGHHHREQPQRQHHQLATTSIPGANYSLGPEPRSQPPPPPTGPQHDVVIAQEHFNGDPAQGQLSFIEGTEIVVLPGEATNGWKVGRYGNQQGWFPIQIVKLKNSGSAGADASAAQPKMSPSDIMNLYSKAPPAPYQATQSSQPLTMGGFGSGGGGGDKDLKDLSPIQPPLEAIPLGQQAPSLPTPQPQQSPQVAQPPSPQQQQQPFHGHPAIHPHNALQQQPVVSNGAGSSDSPQPHSHRHHQVPQHGILTPAPPQQTQQAPQGVFQSTPPPRLQPVQGGMIPKHHAAGIGSQQQHAQPMAPMTTNQVHTPHHNQTAPMGSFSAQLYIPQQQHPTPAPPQQPQQPPAHPTHDTLTELEQEITELQAKKEFMEDHVVTELVTRLCCKLDEVDTQGLEDLRHRRKDLIRKAESIDSSRGSIEGGGDEQQASSEPVTAQQRRLQERRISQQEPPKIIPGPEEVLYSSHPPEHQSFSDLGQQQQQQKQQQQQQPIAQTQVPHQPMNPFFTNFGQQPQQPPPPQPLQQTPMDARGTTSPSSDFFAKPAQEGASNIPLPQQVPMSQTWHPPAGQQVPPQQVQQPQTYNTMEPGNGAPAPSPADQAAGNPIAVPETAGAITATTEEGTYNALSKLESEIDGLNETKDSMERHVVNELITRICCQLDSVEISNDEFRRKRRELIRKAESIEDAMPSARDDGVTGKQRMIRMDGNADMQDGHLPVPSNPFDDLGPSSDEQPIDAIAQSRDFIPSPKSNENGKTVMDSAAIMQLFVSQDERLAQNALSQPGEAPPQQAPAVEVADLLDFGPASSTTPVDGAQVDQPLGPPPVVQEPPATKSAQPLDMMQSAPTEHTVPPPIELISSETKPSSPPGNAAMDAPQKHKDHRHRTVAYTQFEFTGDASQNQLSFPADAHIIVLTEENGKSDGWRRGWYGELHGWFPSSYVQLLPTGKQEAQSTHRQQPQMPTSTPSNGLTSDFETEDLLGGTSFDLHPSFPTLNHCPWQTENEVAAALSTDVQSPSLDMAKKKKKNVPVDGSIKTKPKSKKQPKNSGDSKTKLDAPPALESEVGSSQSKKKKKSDAGSRKLVVGAERNVPLNGEGKIKSKVQKHKKTKKTEGAETAEAEGSVEQFLSRAAPQYTIPNAEHASFDGDASVVSHEFEVMGGVGSNAADPMFWQRRNITINKTAKSMNPAKKKTKPKRKPSKEGGANSETPTEAKGQATNAVRCKSKSATTKKKQATAVEKSSAAPDSESVTTSAAKPAPKSKKKQGQAVGQSELALLTRAAVTDQPKLSREGTPPRSAKMKRKQSKRSVIVPETVGMANVGDEETATSSRQGKMKKKQQSKRKMVAGDEKVIDCLASVPSNPVAVEKKKASRISNSGSVDRPKSKHLLSTKKILQSST